MTRTDPADVWRDGAAVAKGDVRAWAAEVDARVAAQTVAEASAMTVAGAGTDVTAIETRSRSGGAGGGALYLWHGATEPTWLPASARFQTSDGAWWRIAPGLLGLSPLAFGATGDGVADDRAAVQDAIAAAVALDCPVWIDALFGVGAPIAIAEGTHNVRIRGPRGFGEWTEAARVGFRKLSGWRGGALVQVSAETSTSSTSGFDMRGVELDGAGRRGDGLALFRAGNAYVEDVFSHDNPTGHGFRFDGVWTSRFTRLIAKRNGATATGRGGNFRFSHRTRESSDSMMTDCYGNACGHVCLDFDPRLDAGEATPAGAAGSQRDIRQTDWVFRGGEYGTFKSGGAYDGGGPASWVARINGDRCRFESVKFICDRARDPADCVLIGAAGSTWDTEKMKFIACTFQYEPGGVDDHAVRFAGPVREIEFVAHLMEGPGGFMDCDGADPGSGPVVILGGDPDATVVRDTRRIVRNVPGGFAGRAPGAAAAAFGLRSDAPGAGVTIAWLTAALVEHGLALGAGANGNIIRLPDGVGLRLPRAAVPIADPDLDTLCASDGAGGGFDGESGPGIYRWTGTAWVFVG